MAVLICISLIISDVQIFSCASFMYVFFEERSISISCPFLDCIICFFNIDCISCLYILEINPLWIALFLPILQVVFSFCLWFPRLQQYLNHELPDVQAGFRKGRGTRHQIATSAGLSKKQESSRKTSISALLTMPKPLTVWITINCEKFLKSWEYHITLPAS